MATTTTLVDMDVKPVSVTYGAYTASEEVKDKKSGEISTRAFVKATMQEKALTKAKEENTFLVEQSFSYDVPGTVAGFQKLGIPDEELVNILRNGIVAKAGRIIVSFMEELDEQGNPVFQPADGNIDIRKDIAEVGGRRGLSDAEKAWKTISGLKTLPADVLALLQSQLFGQAAQ